MGKNKLSVADVMTLDPVVVTVNASLEEADLMLRSTYIKGIPVVDRAGALVGVISHAHLVAFRFDRQMLPPVQTRSKAMATEPPPPRHRVASP